MKLFQPVTRKSAIQRAQANFERSIRTVFDDTMDLRLQTPGTRAYTATVRITPSKVWCLHSLDSDHQYFYNPFGQVTRSPAASHSPYVEVNFPVEGENLRVAGVFATPATGKGTYLIHTGKIGGGKEGVGKKKFLAWLHRYHRRDVTWCELGGRANGARAILLGRIGATALIHSVITFMYLADEFKRTVGQKTPIRRPRRHKRKGAAKTRGRRRAHKPILPAKTKFSGENYPKTTKRKGAQKVTRRHNDIVQDLKRQIELTFKNEKVDVGNTDVVDLYTTRRRDRKLLQVYEVKTSAGTQSVYTAIGQVLVYSALEKGRPARRTIVLPAGEEERLEELFADTFAEHGIKVMTYAREAGRYRFAPLEF